MNFNYSQRLPRIEKAMNAANIHQEKRPDKISRSQRISKAVRIIINPIFIGKDFFDPDLKIKHETNATARLMLYIAGT